MNNRNRHRFRSLVLRLAVWLFGMALVVVVAAVLIEWRKRAVDADRLPMPGILVDIGSHKMHWWCEGSGGPTVILDAGAVAFSTSWRALMPHAVSNYRVCTFDRSGLGWSEAGPGPWDAKQAAVELKSLLDATGEHEPVIYAGHSLGAMLGQVFAHMYPERVGGLLLLEPADPKIIIRDFNAERDSPLTPDLPDPACGLRCPVARLASLTGLPRWFLSRQNIIDDPLLPRKAVAEFVSRTVLPKNIEHAMVMGRYFPRIFFQTLESQVPHDIPVLFGHGSLSGQLLGDHEDLEEWAADQAETVAAWERTGQLSSRYLGMRLVEGANHLSLTTYDEHARKVAAMIDELATHVREQAD